MQNSKVEAENGLSALASEILLSLAFRFCDRMWSTRTGLDGFGLNDFVAGAVTSKEISILSDGTPWRPLSTF